MPKAKTVDLYINHALFHQNDGTWTVRGFGVTDMGYCFTFPFDHFIGNYPTASVALQTHHKYLRKTHPGWFKK